MSPPPTRPADLARTFDRAPSRRCARAVGRAARWVEKLVGAQRMPHRIAWRVGRLIARMPPPITGFDAASVGSAATVTAGRRILLVSNDLSRSGAPQIVVELARLLIERGDRVTVLSPADGPLRDGLVGAGATVIVDPAIRTPDAPLPAVLARAFDVALCNTVDTVPCAAAITGLVPTVIYTHEVTLLAERLAAFATVGEVLGQAAEVWAGSELSATLVRPVRPDVAVVPYGLDPVRDRAGGHSPRSQGDPAILSVFASFEPRKGQDLLVDAIAMLDPGIRARIRVAMYGRVLFPDFHAALIARATGLPVSFHAPLETDGYRAALLASDAVVVPSRSDTLPLVSLDALGAGRVLMCARSTGTSDYLVPCESGFVAETADVPAFAAMLEGAIARRAEWPTIAGAGERVFARHFSRPAFAALVAARLDALAAARVGRS